MTESLQRRGLVHSMRRLALLTLLASSCSSGVATFRIPSVEFAGPRPGADAPGEPGPNVTTYDLSNDQYFEAHPDGAVTVRSAYEKTIAITCDVGWGRSCALGVGIPAGSACFCKSVWGAIWGHAPGSDEFVDSRFALPVKAP